MDNAPPYVELTVEEVGDRAFPGVPDDVKLPPLKWVSSGSTAHSWSAFFNVPKPAHYVEPFVPDPAKQLYVHIPY